MRKKKVKEEILLGHDAAGKPVFVDTFRHSNANMVLITSNRLYIIQSIAIQKHKQGQNVIIVSSMGPSRYKDACAARGGQFIHIGPTAQHINVMELRPAQTIDDLYMRLKTFFSIIAPPGVMGPESDILESAIVDTYSRFGFTLTQLEKGVEDLETPRAMPVLGDLYQELQGKLGAHRLCKFLWPYAFGAQAYFNHPTDVDWDNSYTVVDTISSTSDCNSLSALSFVVLDCISDMICARAANAQEQSLTAPTTVFLDHSWPLMSNLKSVELFMSKTVKRMPDHNGAIIVATDSVPHNESNVPMQHVNFELLAYHTHERDVLVVRDKGLFVYLEVNVPDWILQLITTPEESAAFPPQRD